MPARAQKSTWKVLERGDFVVLDSKTKCKSYYSLWKANYTNIFCIHRGGSLPSPSSIILLHKDCPPSKSASRTDGSRFDSPFTHAILNSKRPRPSGMQDHAGLLVRCHPLPHPSSVDQAARKTKKYMIISMLEQISQGAVLGKAMSILNASL